MARHPSKSSALSQARGLFGHEIAEYVPRTAPLFCPRQIILTKGCDRTPGQVRLVDAICAAYPDVEVLDRRYLSHSQVDLGFDEPLDRHRAGKQKLVLGEHHSAVRFSDEQFNCCPNYWHFSPYGFCPYGCTYCYLAGTRGVWFSPTVKVFLNLDEMLDRIDRAARQIARPVSFYLGKLQDGLALDSLTGYSRRLVPFFADHPYARLIVLTKCALVDNLMGLEHKGQTILSWSLSPAAVWRQYEPGTPSPRDRLATMRRCGDAGFRLRAVIMPILPVEGWREAYAAMLEELLGIASLERITLGSMCSFPNAIRLTEQKLGSQDEICRLLSCASRSADGRYRFDHDTRVQCYRFLLKVIRDRRPNVEVGLCLEERGVFHQVGLESSIGQCNCVL